LTQGTGDGRRPARDGADRLAARQTQCQRSARWPHSVSGWRQVHSSAWSCGARPEVPTGGPLDTPCATHPQAQVLEQYRLAAVRLAIIAASRAAPRVDTRARQDQGLHVSCLGPPGRAQEVHNGQQAEDDERNAGPGEDLGRSGR